MPPWLGRLGRRIRDICRPPHGPETSRVIVGSTGSGKSEGELADLVRLAGLRRHAVVLLDGHGPLALRTAGHWAARGHEGRLVYEPLDSTDRVLCWNMLPRSADPDPSRRRIEDAETIDEVGQCFLAQRNLASLNDKPWTKEWLEAAVGLGLWQPAPESLAVLPGAFRVGSAEYERLLTRCDHADLVAKFRSMEQLKRRNEVQYEVQTGAGRRLLELVCGSEVVRLRSRPGPFDWLEALGEKKLIVFDGGGLRSREVKRSIFLLASMQVIHAVRRHFAATQRPLPVVLVLEEAGALGLVTPFVMHALQELRKAGLSIHLITQSTVDFGDRDLFEAILANTPWQGWYQALSPADQELGARALANATFDLLAVHYTRPRVLPADGERGGAANRPRFRHLVEATYKTPQLQEQEFRTALATLRVGERFVRDRGGVRRERVKRARPPWLRAVTDASTRAVIDRIRRQPVYVPRSSLPEAEAVPRSLPDAAARLRGRSAR